MEDPIIIMLAAIAHEANRHYCRSIGDDSQPTWDDAPEWQRSSAIVGVRGVLDGNGPGDSHRSWLAEKEATGWVFGPVKDPEKKEHPCMVPFEALPPEQQTKDFLFVNTVTGAAMALGISFPKIDPNVAPSFTAKADTEPMTPGTGVPDLGRRY